MYFKMETDIVVFNQHKRTHESKSPHCPRPPMVSKTALQVAFIMGWTNTCWQICMWQLDVDHLGLNSLESFGRDSSTNIFMWFAIFQALHGRGYGERRVKQAYEVSAAHWLFRNILLRDHVIHVSLSPSKFSFGSNFESYVNHYYEQMDVKPLIPFEAFMEEELIATKLSEVWSKLWNA
jgi:hypothetical protein